VNILFVHQNFPGQYRHLAPALLAGGHRCCAIAGRSAPGLRGLPIERYTIQGLVAPAGLHPWASDLQVKCLRAEAVAHAAIRVQRQGFVPDLIVGHPGWGELLAIQGVFPGVPVLHQLEFVYQLQGGDSGFDPEFPQPDWRAKARLRIRRSLQFSAFHEFDHALAPTEWQASTAPPVFQDRVSVIHEGIDTRLNAPNSSAHLHLKRDGIDLRPGGEVVTYVSRGLEPYRGFHVLMRMLPHLQALRPNCRVVIVGSENVSYGTPPVGFPSWKQAMMAELRSEIDYSRIHFVGRLPLAQLRTLFQLTSCHLYWTYPFVLSWSFLEAMACGALVVGSSTPPVEEVVRNGENGILVDFFRADIWARTVADVLQSPGKYDACRAAARQTILKSYDLYGVCLPAQMSLIDRLSLKP